MSASAPDRTCEYGEADQCPNERKPIFFTISMTRSGCGPALVPGRPLVRSSLAQDRGLDLELVQPVGVIDLEEPIGGDAVAKLARGDQARAPSDRELIGGGHVLVGVQGEAAVVGEVLPLRGVE